MKILVVDDEPTIREIARELLTSAGYDVLEASGGRKALVLAFENQPDLIVLDMMMPGMNGVDVAREIRQDSRLKDTPILMVSGSIDESDANDLLGHLKLAGFLRKKEMVASLVSRVQEILSKQADQVA